jgi:hypothetical protein
MLGWELKFYREVTHSCAEVFHLLDSFSDSSGLGFQFFNSIVDVLNASFPLFRAHSRVTKPRQRIQCELFPRFDRLKKCLLQNFF